jgi:autotransporter translocation and assembly factor TamB
VDWLVVDARVEQLDLRLFDYQLRNAGPIRIVLDRHAVQIVSPSADAAARIRLEGEDTQLDLSGGVGLKDDQLWLEVIGDANLGILQGFFRDIRGSGRARVVGSVKGSTSQPLFNGIASVADGRLRHFSVPHSLDALNGRIVFSPSGIRIDDVAGRVGNGPVRFGGRIGLDGFFPADLDLTVVGENMNLRYPEGFRSLVDADLALRGRFSDPVLTGIVTVESSSYTRRVDLGAGILELAGVGGQVAQAIAEEDSWPVRFDVRILAPSTLQIDNNLARIRASADLNLRGTYDKPLLFGRVEIERGEIVFEGRRYHLRHGTIDFSNPTAIEPFFDLQAETRVRVPGETYTVVMDAVGTRSRLSYNLSSDPPLPEISVISLLLGDVRGTQDAELRALRQPNVLEQELLQALARFGTGPISSEVGRVFEQTFGVDSFQITPSLIDPYQGSRQLSPGARLTIGKRISDRAYLTYSRSLTAADQDQIILLEFTQSSRLSWILTRNEDESYALDVRVRHIF